MFDHEIIEKLKGKGWRDCICIKKYIIKGKIPQAELEQLQRLHSENTPPSHPMITHTIDSYQIPSQNMTKVKVINLNNLPKILILECCKKITCDTPSEVA